LDTPVEEVCVFAGYAADQGHEFACWEPTPISREMLIHLNEAKALYERFNENAPVPVYILLDVGHQWSHEQTGKDRDPYVWLLEMAKHSPTIHLQQMDGLWDGTGVSPKPTMTKALSASTAWLRF
jgi:sugar phosphate isomerase/epimerase